MPNEFPELLRRLRAKKNISQQQLAKKLYVDRSTIASWETGRRVPDAMMLSQLAVCLDTDVAALLGAAAKDTRRTQVMVVDDEKIILSGSLSVLRETMPDAEVRAFLRPSEALAHARRIRVDLAFVDIEMGAVSGFDLCRALLEINPNLHVVFLTAYPDYSLPAWDTGACGFLLKPLTAEKIQTQLSRLRVPIAETGVENA